MSRRPTRADRAWTQVVNNDPIECGDTLILRILAQPEALPQAREAIARVADSVGFGEEERCHAILALDEALANVIKHGYGSACAQPIEIAIGTLRQGERAGLRVTIRDFGRQVEPGAICGRDLDDVRPGGLGVHIIRSVMDEVVYEKAEPCGMRLTMTKWVKR